VSRCFGPQSYGPQDDNLRLIRASLMEFPSAGPSFSKVSYDVEAQCHLPATGLQASRKNSNRFLVDGRLWFRHLAA